MRVPPKQPRGLSNLSEGSVAPSKQSVPPSKPSADSSGDVVEISFNTINPEPRPKIEDVLPHYAVPKPDEQVYPPFYKPPGIDPFLPQKGGWPPPPPSQHQPQPPKDLKEIEDLLVSQPLQESVSVEVEPSGDVVEISFNTINPESPPGIEEVLPPLSGAPVPSAQPGTTITLEELLKLVNEPPVTPSGEPSKP